MPSLTPQQFVDNWQRSKLSEKASAQSHFNDLCRLVGHQTPTQADPKGEYFAFEYGIETASGKRGYADVWYKGHFAIEYKRKGRYATLDEAYQQLLRYREKLQNPPLLIVCDFEHWEIHTNWTNTESRVYRFTNQDIATDQNVQRWLHGIFFDPNVLHPGRSTDAVTKEAAHAFELIAENMRRWQVEPARIAHFLTKLVFCLFAEDVELLPKTDNGVGVFSEIVQRSKHDPGTFVDATNSLFEAMAVGKPVFWYKVPFFDGNLFNDVTVEPMPQGALTALETACRMNWSSVEPAIFGTLFERSLDPAKRAQLGAHYTSRDDILLIVEPVLMLPLHRAWDAIRQQVAPARTQYDAARSEHDRHIAREQLNTLRGDMLRQLRTVTVLDPACGSGNFLYVALQLLLALEKEVIQFPAWQGIGLDDETPQVHPRQLYGIEKDEIAHDLASVVVWIGYIQWRQNNGYPHFNTPILEPLDNMRLMDAILAFDDAGNPVEPAWPRVDVIVSNPPFLGGNKIRQELGGYVDQLFSLYADRVPAFADLVCYWFEKARAQIEQGNTKRAGLLATNSIRGGANREVLKRIKETGDIFMAWADREWILEGAAVRVSMVGFDDGTEPSKMLNDSQAQVINPDLTSSVDITIAKPLPENSFISFMGPSAKGPFDIDSDLAEKMLGVSVNENNRPNSDVIRPVISGIDIVRRFRGKWTIDFGMRTIEEAAQYQVPYEYVQKHVYPIRTKNRRAAYAEKWWQYAEPRPGMREALQGLERFVSTPTLATYRVFVWLSPQVLSNQQTIIFARSDDYFFGVLHSRLHEVWALRMGTWLGKGNDPRYTPTTTFETFPFPWSPGQEPTDHPAHAAISAAAKQLHEEREAWLNPPGASEKALKNRTLTNLYNALLVFRNVPPPDGKRHPKITTEAGNFAPRLDALHRALDRAVCDAYGWEHAVIDDDEEILRRLLALNLVRAGGG